MDQIVGRFEIVSDAAAMARRVAEWMSAILLAKEAARVSLSGGSTPKLLYELLASPAFIDQIPWERISWFWGDERFVPHDDPASNYRMARAAMLNRVPAPPANIHPIPTDGSPEDAARRYERILQRAYGASTLDPARPLFDITLLGLGADGHTASLLPNAAVLNERQRWVAAVSHGRPETRITLTYPALESSGHVAFLVTGPEKAAILKQIRGGDTRLPAARLHPAGELVWFVDRAAAGNR